MNQLPTVIQFEILNFLHHFDRLEYCRVNKLCSEEFSAASRIITFRYGRGLDQFMEDEWFRDSIIRKLKDPSNQLSLQLLYGERPFHSFAINVKSLKTSTLLFQQFHLEESIIRHLALTPSFFNRTRHTSVLNEVRKVTGLKDLTISSFKDDVHQLPIIPQLERLEIVSCTLSANISLRLTTELKNLRCLKLDNCEGISDVSSLGNIYELHIIKCLKITNITALNNNEIITIQSSQVEDYSQSFQYSRVIDVSFAWTNTRNIDFTRLEKVQRLKLDYLTVNLVTSISIPALPSTLTSLTLVNISAECSLPAKHSLRELIIEDCPRFSLDNMANIPSVSFSNCYQIKDWTLLQNNSSVMVKSCANFNSLQLTNVKILRVEFPYRFLFISDIGNITHLKLTKVITSYQESFFTRLLAASETLQEIELEIDPQLVLRQDGKLFLQSFQQLSTIKKIIININIKIQRDSNQFKEFYHLVKGLLGHVFSVEVSSTLSKVYLLPHRENNDQRSYRNKNCNDQMSYRNKNCLVM